MTITTSDVLQSFLTAIKDLHSTILHMILKLFFKSWRLKKYWYLLFWCSSHAERLRILDLIFPPIFLVNKTTQRQRILNLLNWSQISLQISTNTWKLKKKLLMSKNGTRFRFWNSLPQKKTCIAAAITTWFQNKLIILDSIIYLRKNVNVNKIK